ncbi:MAG: GntR family transcriptional regulator, partial [Lachnospiraceae bacterium]|nr:GntR family transcriptional regulator [Lachnospiraceae bacterium]
INEQELVEKFGFSKAPIREALLSLCNEGVLHNIPRYGYEVVRLTSEDAAHILRFRFHLEGGFLKDCYQRITESQLEELAQLDELCNASSHDLWLHWEHNTNFHLKLISCAGNEYAFRELQRSMDILKRAYAQTYWNRWSNIYNPMDMRYHKQILSCIRSRDIDSALHYLELDLKDFGCM